MRRVARRLRAGGAGRTYERPVSRRPGPQRLAIEAGAASSRRTVSRDPARRRVLAEDGLTDLRLVTEGGRPVPHLLIHPSSPEREWIRGSAPRIAPTKKTSGFEVDLGAPAAVDMIRVEGLPSPHLKRLTLEGSGDRAHWTMLVAEGTLFDLPDELLRQNTLGFAAGPYRYFRVTWNDANSGRVPNPAAVSARRVSSRLRRQPRRSSRRSSGVRASRASAAIASGCRRPGCRSSRWISTSVRALPAATSTVARS